MGELIVLFAGIVAYVMFVIGTFHIFNIAISNMCIGESYCTLDPSPATISMTPENESLTSSQL